MGERERNRTVEICKPRIGVCTKEGTEVRVAADPRVAWINYSQRYLCKKHAEQWDKELDVFIETMIDDRWSVRTSWIKARDMGLFIKDGMDFKAAYDLVQSGHGYKRPVGPVRIS